MTPKARIAAAAGHGQRAPCSGARSGRSLKRAHTPSLGQLVWMGGPPAPPCRPAPSQVRAREGRSAGVAGALSGGHADAPASSGKSTADVGCSCCGPSAPAEAPPSTSRPTAGSVAMPGRGGEGGEVVRGTDVQREGKYLILPGHGSAGSIGSPALYGGGLGGACSRAAACRLARAQAVLSGAAAAPAGGVCLRLRGKRHDRCHWTPSRAGPGTGCS